MASVARTHFNEDIARAKDQLALADRLEVAAADPPELWRDVRLAAVAMAVGAMDAYFCDKYVDCLTCALRKYANGKWKGRFRAAYGKALIPAGQVLSTSRKSRPHWGIRMAARSVMARDNMYSLSKVPDAFNAVLPSGQTLWDGVIEEFIKLNRTRFTGTKWSVYSKLTGQAKAKAKRKAVAHLVRRVGQTVQRRHDWIHNCGRPQSAIQSVTKTQAAERVREIKDLVTIVDDHIDKHRLA